MKKLLSILLFTVPLFCRAQNDTAKYKQTNEYCLAQVYASGTKYEAYIDDGHKKSQKEMEIKDARGKAMEFGSMVNVINYMAKRGWAPVTSYPGVERGIAETSVIFKRPL